VLAQLFTQAADVDPEEVGAGVEARLEDVVMFAGRLSLGASLRES
jgi:hypothetical protein